MPPDATPQPPRFAIQKARGKGWSTLEVGEVLPQAEARFRLMVSVNPKAYFRLIQLDYNPDSSHEGMEFNWKLLQLHDPNQNGGDGQGGRMGAAKKRPGGKPGAQSTRHGSSHSPSRRPTPPARERVALPWRVYGMVIVLGLAVGALVYLHHAAGTP